MAAQWERWLRYAKAKLDDTVKKGDAELDRREAEQRRRAEAEPWLASESDAPTLDEARARIEHQTRQAEEADRARRAAAGAASPPSAPAGSTPSVPAPTATGPSVPPPLTTDPQLGSIDFAAQQRAADERLAKMRQELGLDKGPPDADDDPPSGPA
jgi:hypothetical protein